MRIITLIFALIGSISFSQNMFIGTSNGELWKTDPATCNATLIGSCPNFVDVAFLPNGKLYGQTFSAIYEVDTLTAASTLVMTVSSGNALVGAPNGMLYGVSGTSLIEIDVVNGTSTNLGNVTCSSGGDLAFFDGELYLACSGNNLLKIDIANPSASTVVGNMSISGAAYGLVNAVNGCQEFPYVMSSTGLLYPLDYNTAAVGAPCSMGNSGSIWGAASPNEFAGSGGHTNLLGNDTTICNQSNITFNLPNNPNTSYLWSDNSTSNSLTVNSSGNYWVNVTDNIAGCTLFDSVNVTFISSNSPDTIIDICMEQQVDFTNYITPPLGTTWHDGNLLPTTTSHYLNSGNYQFYYINSGVCSDTVGVNFNVIYDSLNIGSDTTICYGEVLVYGVSNTPNLVYSWEDGYNQSLKAISSTGTYHLSISDSINSCTLKDTAHIQVLPAPNAGYDTSLNFCDYYGLNFIDFIAGNPDTGGVWYNNDGSVVSMPINQSKLYNSPYRYIVNDNGCRDTSYVSTTNIFADLLGFNYFPTLIFTEQTDVNFTSLSVADSLRWLINNNSVSTASAFTHKFNTNGTQNICLILFTDNCIDTICEDVLIRDEINIYIPNSFTPNNDGFNDEITPSIAGSMEEYEFTVFNRWGEEIFKTSNVGDTWDGTHENEKVSIGIYSWKLSYKIPNTVDIIVKHGYFMLLK